MIWELSKIWCWTVLKTKRRRNNIFCSRYTFKYSNKLEIVTSDMITVLLVLEKVIYLAALFPSSPHLYTLLIPFPHVLRRDPIVFIIQVFRLVIKITNYNLVEMFCTFWVNFCWLCSTNFRVSLLKLVVPILSNRFSWNFFSLRMKLCSRPWLSHWGSELTPLHNCVLLIRWQKLLLCTSTHPWIMATLCPVSKHWSQDLSTCKPWIPSVNCCTILHSPLSVWQPVEDSSVDLWQLQLVYLGCKFHSWGHYNVVLRSV